MAHMGRSAAVIIVKVGSTEVFSSVSTQISVFPALLILGMNQQLYELKLRSNSYCYSAPPFSLRGEQNP